MHAGQLFIIKDAMIDVMMIRLDGRVTEEIILVSI